MAIKRIGNRPKKNLSPEQKVAFALLIVLGLGGVFFGAKSFGANLMRPIQLQIASIYETEPLVTSGEREAQEMEEAKTKDTDGDGLVDYDELYIYQTSPYLVDSDSDNYDDKTEVYSGNDPNCPQGKDCGVVVSAEETNNTGTSVEGLVNPLGADSGIMDAAEFDFSSPEEVEQFFKQATIDEIRNALMAAGMSEEELSIIDDATLEAYFLGTLEQASQTGALDDLVTDTSATGE